MKGIPHLPIHFGFAHWEMRSSDIRYSEDINDRISRVIYISELYDEPGIPSCANVALMSFIRDQNIGSKTDMALAMSITSGVNKMKKMPNKATTITNFLKQLTNTNIYNIYDRVPLTEINEYEDYMYANLRRIFGDQQSFIITRKIAQFDDELNEIKNTAIGGHSSYVRYFEDQYWASEWKFDPETLKYNTYMVPHSHVMTDLAEFSTDNNDDKMVSFITSMPTDKVLTGEEEDSIKAFRNYGSKKNFFNIKKF